MALDIYLGTYSSTLESADSTLHNYKMVETRPYDRLPPGTNALESLLSGPKISPVGTCLRAMAVHVSTQTLNASCIRNVHPCPIGARRSSRPQSCPWRQASFYYVEFKPTFATLTASTIPQRVALPFTTPHDPNYAATLLTHVSP